jgi:hypothetical protein
MFNLIREASNFRAALPEMNGPESVCERYSNHVGAHLLGLLAMARFLDDGRKFNAVLYGTDRSIPLAISWTDWFNHAVYGEPDKPIGCHKSGNAVVIPIFNSGYRAGRLFISSAGAPFR